ncbi:MAG: hypothetical protein KF787_10280 [Phycisphaeraceae bacterium]|nr:hypothetical protein [Phycisphaerae bacterium]MBX3393021.1 hypothetical protein [Phycisphaeraceae bacterium]
MPHGIAAFTLALRPTLAILLAVAACLPAIARGDLSAPGPFQPGYRTVTVTRPNNSTFSAVLFYPALSAGQNTPFDPSSGPCPAVSFGHGFFQPVSRYQSTLEHLATHGFLVIASESEGSLFPSHPGLAADMRHGLTYLEQQNANPVSFLFGSVNTAAFGMSGHSMGGGCAILAADDDPRVKALAPLAAADTNPSSKTAALSVPCPSMYIDGSQDTIVPPGPNGQVMYANTPAPKRRALILGGFHCGFTDSQTFGCDTGSMPRSEQLSIVRRLLTEFFSLHLRQDQTLWNAVWGPALDDDPRLSTLAQPYATVGPDAPAITGPAGQTVQTTLTVTNTATVPAAYALLAEGSAWPIAFDPPVTPSIPPGQSAVIALAVSIPALDEPALASFLISARSQSDLATRAWTTLAVNALCGADFDGSGFVDIEDYAAFIAAFEDGDDTADFDGSGFVDIEDFTSFVASFENGC